jgi:hypothetical protein
MPSSLASYCFCDARVFLIPIEQLDGDGIAPAFAAELEAHGIATAWIARFGEAYRCYRSRAEELARRAPETWFPPRKQNVCVVRDAARTRPYYLPFNKSSWLFYAEDFDAQLGDVELGAYLFFHTERLCLTQNPTAAALHNLGYWLLRSGEERAAFARAAARSTRPDAAALRAIAAALGFVERIHHAELAPLGKATEAYGQIPHTGLLVPISLQAEVTALGRAMREASAQVARDYFAGFTPAPGAAARLVEWIAAAAPDVLVTGAGGDTVWDPASPRETARLRQVLGEIADEVAESVREDLAVAGAHSRRFVAALKDPDALPRPGADIEQTGLVYLHRERRLCAYNLAEPDMNRLAEVAAPYERLMLGARTIHEWGHLAVDAGLVRVARDDAGEHARATRVLAELFDDIARDAPAELRDVVRHETKSAGGVSLGAVLVARILGRMPDYQSNLLARRLLSADEMETYVRQQATTLAQEQLGPYGQLARYAYELQYLHLSRVPDAMDYFLDSTWFGEQFVEPGIITLARFAELAEAVRAVCATYSIDEDAFVPGALSF